MTWRRRKGDARRSLGGHGPSWPFCLLRGWGCIHHRSELLLCDGALALALATAPQLSCVLSAPVSNLDVCSAPGPTVAYS